MSFAFVVNVSGTFVLVSSIVCRSRCSYCFNSFRVLVCGVGCFLRAFVSCFVCRLLFLNAFLQLDVVEIENVLIVASYLGIWAYIHPFPLLVVYMKTHFCDDAVSDIFLGRFRSHMLHLFASLSIDCRSFPVSLRPLLVQENGF